MNIEKIREQVLSRSMDRKQFLQIMFAVALSVIGVTSFLTNIVKFTNSTTEKNINSGFSYGETNYGQ